MFLEGITENNIHPPTGVKQGTAVYRTVRMVVWKVGTGNYPVPPIRL